MLDTNALFWPFTHGVRLEAELARLFPGQARLGVPRSVLAELDRLVARRVPNAPAARQLANRWTNLASQGVGDAAVLATARRLHAVVASSDERLLQQARLAGLAVLRPRDRARLELRPPSTTPPARATVKTRPTVVRRPRAGA